MSVYDVDFSKVGPRLLPPDKRQPLMLSWIAAILAPLQWVANLWFKEYRTGSTALLWLSTTTYVKYQRVIYNTIVYESLINGNTSLPTVTSAWQVVQGNFIGISERILYTGQTLTLTYALNKRLMTTFRQPPNVSDVYISNNVLTAFPFIIGATDQGSSDIFSNTSSDFIINNYSFTSRYNFNINIPVAVYNALDPIPANRATIVRAFVNQYLPAGITYNIVTY